MEGVMGGWRRASTVNRTETLERKGEKTTARSRRSDVLYSCRREMVAVVAMVLRRPRDQRPPGERQIGGREGGGSTVGCSGSGAVWGKGGGGHGMLWWETEDPRRGGKEQER